MKKQLFFSLALLTVASADLYAPRNVPVSGGSRTPAPAPVVVPTAKLPSGKIAVSSVADLQAKYSSPADLASIALAAEKIAGELSTGGDNSSQAYKDAMNVLS
ncbi:MAG: hypothetical protein NTZ68_00785 [Candidatus Dependentiae bacterium]|nr:hypothetical protein [Candidatus Dependentiae bacterium]